MCSAIFSEDPDIEFRPSGDGFISQRFSPHMVDRDGSDGGGLDSVFFDKPVIDKISGCSAVDERGGPGRSVFSYEVDLNPE